jgi:hypothetical protein
VAEQHHARRAVEAPVERRGHAVAVQLGVRARRDGDRVLARGVDGDQRDAGRHAGELRDCTDVDPLVRQLAERRRAEIVVADRADERHRGAEPRCGDRLVGALAAAVAGEAAARHRLARPRQRGNRDDEVGVDRADDDDARGGAGHARIMTGRPPAT